MLLEDRVRLQAESAVCSDARMWSERVCEVLRGG